MTVQRVVSADGTAIAVDRQGSGPAVVLLAGAMCARGRFAGLAELLAADHEVLNVDRRGRGDSGDTPPYAVAREVEDVAAVLAAVDRPAALFGHSSGAALALEAVASGVTVDRLLLFEPPYQLDPATNPHPADLAERYAGLVAAGRRGDAVELFMTVVGMPPEAIAGARTQPFWAGMEAIAHTLAYDAAVLGDASFPQARAALVTAPTVVMYGGLSPAWAAPAADAVAATVTHGRAVRIDGQAHDIDDATLAAAIRSALEAEVGAPAEEAS